MTSFFDGQQRAIAPLYNPAFERDACGVGLVVDIKGRPSRDIVERALGGLVNLTHRGGVGADARTGDGAGILTQIPTSLFAEDLAGFGAAGLGDGDFAIAMVFLPTDADEAGRAREAFAGAVAEKGLQPLGWRIVPTDASVLGYIAAATQPGIEQLFIRKPEGRSADEFERGLMLARRAGERALLAA